MEKSSVNCWTGVGNEGRGTHRFYLQPVTEG